MPTLTALKNQIASELHRSDLTTQIGAAITAAVRSYQRERFWFLEERAVLTASASQAWYAVPSNFDNNDSMLITVSGTKTPLPQVTYTEIDEKDDGVTYGIPTEFAVYQDQFRFYPAPDDEYVFTLSYHKHLDAPSDSGSNAWTNAAYDLIRCRAEGDVMRYYTHAPSQRVAAVKEGEAEAYVRLIMENTAKLSTGRLRRSGW
jgi:hypothetical protein